MSDAPPPTEPAPPRLTMAQLIPTDQPFVHCTLDTAGARRLLELTDDPDVIAELVLVLADAVDVAHRLPLGRPG